MSRLLTDPIDLHKAIKSKDIEVAADQSVMADPVGGAPISLEWLRFAAREYHISPNIKDYVLVPMIIVPVGFPNRNGMGFKLDDLVKFNTDYKMQSYKTWTACPTHYEHQNTDITKALGVVFDVHMRKSTAGNYWKILTYLGYDRSKYTALVKRIAEKDLNNASMGAMVTGGYTCSICDRKYGNCTHISKADPNRIRMIDKAGQAPQLAYRVGRDPVGFEVSAVEVPAWSIANCDKPHLIDPNAVYIG